MDQLEIQAYFVCICPLITILALCQQVIFKWEQVKIEIYWCTWQVEFNCSITSRINGGLKAINWHSNILLPLYFYLQMLWEYKRKFAKDQKFEKTVQDRFCVADLKRVIVDSDNVSKLVPPRIIIIKIITCNC